MLPMDAARPSTQDGSEARDEVVHACCESEGGTSDDSSAMCCCRGSSAESFAQLPTVQVRSAEAKAATRAGMARCGVGRGHGRVIMAIGSTSLQVEHEPPSSGPAIKF